MKRSRNRVSSEKERNAAETLEMTDESKILIFHPVFLKKKNMFKH